MKAKSTTGEFSAGLDGDGGLLPSSDARIADLRRFVAIAAQVVILFVVCRQFHLVGPNFITKLLPLAFFGFLEWTAGALPQWLAGLLVFLTVSAFVLLPFVDRSRPGTLGRRLWLAAFVLLILVWLLYRFGYKRKALLWQTLVAWMIIPISYVVSDPSENINWVHGFGREPQTWMPGPLFVGLLMVLFPLGLYLPTHLMLSRIFSEPH